MPRFYFDITDCDVMSPDDEGLDLTDLEAARKEALATLGSLAKDELPDGNRRDFGVSIRDGSPGLSSSLLSHCGLSSRRKKKSRQQARAERLLSVD